MLKLLKTHAVFSQNMLTAQWNQAAHQKVSINDCKEMRRLTLLPKFNERTVATLDNLQYSELLVWRLGIFFVNYGSGTQWEDETVHIPKHQKAHILNLDKSSLIIDGTMQQRGVHLSASSYDKLIPVLGMIAWTISQSSTLIIGSTATGEVLPPLFQFSTEADHEYIHLKTLWFIKNIGGKVLTWWGEIVSLHFWIAW